MVSAFTPNIQAEEPARGDQVGVWDTPENNNWTLIDKVVGGIATIPLNNANVVLSAAQFQSKQITFNSTLTGNVIVTFPTSFTKSYEIQNLCTGSSAFTITLTTTAAGHQAICAPPGEIIDSVNDGTNLKYKNLGRIGEYWDYAGATVPNWVSGCTIPPYVNCDGSVISAVTYPALAAQIGTTLPDTRGRARFALNQGTGRLTAAVSIDGNTAGTGGGGQSAIVAQANLPNVSFAVSGSVNVFASGVGALGVVAGSATTTAGGTGAFNAYDANKFASLTAAIAAAVALSGGSGTPLAVVPPAYVGGLTLIRAA
jgi:hypothetical protein